MGKLNQKLCDRIHHIFQFIEYDNLTDWEDHFVDSVSEQFDKSSFLSERQIEILERIFKQAAERDFSGHGFND